MIKERYCSVKISRLLREKGFDKSIREFYDSSGTIILYATNKEGFKLSELNGVFYPHITHQMAIDWLREIHKIHIEITIEGINSFICYKVYIRPFKKIYPTRNYDSIDIIEIPVEYSSFEEAIENAIMYYLTELI